MSEDLQKMVGDLTDVVKAASDKADTAVKNGEEYGGEIKSLISKTGELAENIQKITLANEEKAKQDEKLEKLISRIGNNGEEETSAVSKTYHQKMNAYLRKGDKFAPTDAECSDAIKGYLSAELKTEDKDVIYDAMKAMQSGVNADGGYLILPDRRAGIKDIRDFETSPMRSLAEIVSIATDEYEVVIDDDESASGGWVSETQTRLETATAKVGVIKIPVHEQYAQPKVTQKFLDDASINVEQYVANKTNDILVRTENTAFVSGDGASKPKGFLEYAAWSVPKTYERGKIEQISSGSAAAVTYDGLIKLQNSLKAIYSSGAKFMLKRDTWEHILLLKDSQNRPLLRPDLLLNGAELRLLGKGVVFADDMPAVVADSLSIAYGDFGRSYTIVDRLGVRTLRDPYTEKPFVKYYSTKRVGGAVTNFEGIKIQKIQA